MYFENYCYNMFGEFLEIVGYLGDDGGKQILWFVYWFYFGDFFGMLGKVLFVVLGMMFIIILVIGINIWLKKCKIQDVLNCFWFGLVWGVLNVLVVSVIGYFVFGLLLIVCFWVVLVGFMLVVLKVIIQEQVVCKLKYVFIFVIGVFFIVYFVEFGSVVLSLVVL